MLHDITRESLKGIVKTSDDTSTRKLMKLVEQLLYTLVDELFQFQDTVAREVRLNWLSSLAVEVMVLRGKEGVYQVRRSLKVLAHVTDLRYQAHHRTSGRMTQYDERYR